MIQDWIRNSPIKAKLTAITLCSASAALIAALAVFLAVHVGMTRDSAATNLRALAEIVASNAAGPLAFEDHAAANATLQSLRANGDIECVRLVNTEGRELTRVVFISRGGFEDFELSASQGAHVTLRGAKIHVQQPVVYGGEVLGRLELLADVYGVLKRLVLIGGAVLVVILAGALGLTYFLVSRLQRPITAPLSSLAKAANTVACSKDYSLRVERCSNDEVGELTTAFNHMLEEIGARDLAVSAAKQQLAAQVVVLQREITERQRAESELHRAKEAAEAAARSKSAFLAAMSHEIRTPMNGVLATANLLLESPLNDEQRELSSLIRVSGEGLLMILNDILDFSKIEAGRVELEQADFDLRELIEDALELHAVAAAGKGLDMAADVSPKVRTEVRGDPYRLRQVLMNLIGNAVKFTSKGEVVVSVSIISLQDGIARYRIEIRDSGIGMSETAQAQLFQPFNQADVSTTRKFGGTGLGLAISRGLVELMGGTIDVQSRESVGSVFSVEVPLELQPLTDSAIARVETALNDPVLIVEPSTANRERLRRQLAAWSIKSIDVPDAEAALATIRSGVPLAAALICLVPAAGPGLELSRRLRSEPSWHSRPVVLLSNQAERLAGRPLDADGVSACLYRPMRMRQLMSTLRRLLGLQDVLVESIEDTLGTAEVVPLKVLFVEDNVVNQRVGSLMLRKFKCDITLAEDGVQALERLGERPYDLVLMDCQMPNLDGFETTRRIRAMESTGEWRQRKRQLIVAMTANAMQGVRERCLECGMDEYLSKPMQLRELERIVQLAVSARDTAFEIHPAAISHTPANTG